MISLPIWNESALRIKMASIHQYQYARWRKASLLQVWIKDDNSYLEKKGQIQVCYNFDTSYLKLTAQNTSLLQTYRCIFDVTIYTRIKIKFAANSSAIWETINKTLDNRCTLHNEYQLSLKFGISIGYGPKLGLWAGPICSLCVIWHI